MRRFCHREAPPGAVAIRSLLRGPVSAGGRKGRPYGVDETWSHIGGAGSRIAGAWPCIGGRMISAPTASEEARTAPFPPGVAKTALFSLLLPFPTEAVVRLRRGPH